MLESEGEAPLRPVLPFNQCLKEEIKVQKAIIGKKIGMTQIFDETGKVIPVTVIEAGPCTVVQKKTAEKDGYDSVQLGFCDVNEKKMTKPAKGHFEKAGVAPKKYLKEFRLDDCAAHNVGDTILADVFVAGEKIDVVGISKGKGYAGVVKRWNCHSQEHTHGVVPVHRSIGSMGANTDPSRVMPGKKMAGHLGVEQVTIQNLEVVKVDAESNMIAVRGAIPGPKGGIVFLKDAVKKA